MYNRKYWEIDPKSVVQTTKCVQCNKRLVLKINALAGCCFLSLVITCDVIYTLYSNNSNHLACNSNSYTAGNSFVTMRVNRHIHTHTHVLYAFIYLLHFWASCVKRKYRFCLQVIKISKGSAFRSWNVKNSFQSQTKAKISKIIFSKKKKLVPTVDMDSKQTQAISYYVWKG